MMVQGKAGAGARLGGWAEKWRRRCRLCEVTSTVRAGEESGTFGDVG